jgi:four helix bundle protein
MSEKEMKDLKSRTKEFAIEIIRFYSNLSKSTVVQVLGRQMLRSGTSVGAQYREGTRAKSNADFISKMEGSLQELEETQYWLELLEEFVSHPKILPLKRESDELIAIFVTIVTKVKGYGKKS